MKIAVRTAKRLAATRGAAPAAGRDGLLHGDLHHYNVLRDAERGWVAVDPEGVVGEIAYEVGAALRNPYEQPALFIEPRRIEKRVERFALKFPLRAFIKCAACGRGVTASWSKGRSARYAYYHCLPPCRSVNITNAKLEGLFVDELERFQPTPGYMRLSMSQCSAFGTTARRRSRARWRAPSRELRRSSRSSIRLDDAFIYKESIDLGTYERQRDRLREELTLVEIDRHGSKVEEFDVEGILNFAERVLQRRMQFRQQLQRELR